MLFFRILCVICHLNSHYLLHIVLIKEFNLTSNTYSLSLIYSLTGSSKPIWSPCTESGKRYPTVIHTEFWRKFPCLLRLYLVQWQCVIGGHQLIERVRIFSRIENAWSVTAQIESTGFFLFSASYCILYPAAFRNYTVRGHLLSMSLYSFLRYSGFLSQLQILALGRTNFEFSSLIMF